MSLSSLVQHSTYASDPRGFLDQASFLARTSELAYSDDAEWIAQSLGLPAVTLFPDATFQPLPNTQGFWFRHEGIAGLVFRGSANRGHWLANFKVQTPLRPNHPWGTAHPGFATSLEPVIDPVLRPFAAAAAGADIVWLSGHSLGGALAVLAAAWLHIEKKLIPALLTFGQPMPGFANFRTRFDAELPGRLTRLINRSDLVPRLPGLGYAHCGTSKTITSGTTLQALGSMGNDVEITDEDAIPADPATLDHFLANLESAPDEAFAEAQLQGKMIGGLPWFAHHNITEYGLQLQRLRQSLA